MEDFLHDFSCPSPEGETDKAFKVWNGKGYSYLAKSQMKDVSIADGEMTFRANGWFGGLHPWLRTLGE